MDTQSFLTRFRADLRKNSDAKTRESSRRYFKEAAVFYGVRSSHLSLLNHTYFKEISSLPKAEIFMLCEELFKSDISEEAFIAADWAYKVHRFYTVDDWNTFEHWVKNYINNWAKCDSLCNHAIGTLLDMYPSLMPRLKSWTSSNNRWVKRASAVTLIVPARQGKFLSDIFEIADILLLDPDDMVQKGYGWMLKEASKAHQNEVYEYVINHKATMPRTALRYAIEKMPPDLRAQAMKK